MLELTGICKHFAARRVVAPVCLKLRPGEFFSLLGPSGCGKTTLLRMIAGFEHPDQGSIHIGGADVTALPPYRRPCNMVFQRYALFPHLNVAANVDFGLRVKKVAAPERQQRVAAALALVGMQDFGDRWVATLSGGQQQRIAIARALVNEPQVLLLDEPLSALDLKLRQHMQIELLALQRRLATTFLYVTHAQDEALTLSDRIAVMNAGVIEQIGTPQEVYDRPETPFVASFIGQSSRLPGSVLAARDGQDGINMRLDSGELVGARLLPNAALPAPGTRMALLVRPERVTLSPPSEGEPSNRLPARIKQILFKGTSFELHAELGEDGRLDGPKPMLVAALPRGVAPPAAGAELTLYVRAADALAVAEPA